ncbi:MAG: amidase [Anaerolineae bacterium]|nr:amidase [Anaerolineae bacterium]
MSDSIVALSVTDMAQQLREGRITAVETVEAHIARIEAINPALNAVVTKTYDTAREQARQADEVLKQGKPLGWLHGVPFTLKDCHETAGVLSTCGLVSRRDHVPDKDSFVTAQLKAAGAILLGKTNLPDNCWSQETNNPVFGRTNNPWDVTRTVGGSSGGSAAIVAAEGAAFDVGSDIAGSIRMPAAFTGIVGLRPTSGTISEVGNWPYPSGRLADLEAVGPMTRRVEDAALVFDVLRGVESAPLDTSTLAEQPIAFWYSDGLVTANTDVKRGVDAATQALAAVGMKPFAKQPASLRAVMIGWTAYLQNADLRALSAGFGNGEAWTPAGEIMRTLRGQGRVSPEALAYWFGSNYMPVLWRWLVDGARWRNNLRSQLKALIGDGVAVCPIFPTEAPAHGWNLHFPPMVNLGFQMWVNLAGLPGLTVPTGYTTENLPIGVQIVGNAGSERTILTAGLAIQQALMPRWKAPPMIERLSENISNRESL